MKTQLALTGDAKTLDALSRFLEQFEQLTPEPLTPPKALQGEDNVIYVEAGYGTEEDTFVVGDQTKEETAMKLYGGIDLHANNSVVAILDEQDHQVYQKRLRNDLAEILPQLAPYQTELQGLVVESTYNWYWLVDGLLDAGYQVHLANTAAIQQ